MIELTVILKDSERSYRQKFLIYEIVSLVIENPTIVSCIEEAKKNFQGDPEDIRIKATMEVI